MKYFPSQRLFAQNEVPKDIYIHDTLYNCDLVDYATTHALMSEKRKELHSGHAEQFDNLIYSIIDSGYEGAIFYQPVFTSRNDLCNMSNHMCLDTYWDYDVDSLKKQLAKDGIEYKEPYTYIDLKDAKKKLVEYRMEQKTGTIPKPIY